MKHARKSTFRKALLIACSAVLLVALSVGVTFAFLTSTKEVVNTFTVGKVAIDLDEAKVDENGVADTTAARVASNDYKLLPGHTYTKDPTVTVKKGSESSYVRLLVTVSKSSELDAIFAPAGANLTSIFNGYDAANWTLASNKKNNDNTRTYEFRYKETVAAPTADVKLDALFDSITVPGSVTNAQLATIEGMKITIVAQAIQADGFSTADLAWAAFPAT